MMLGPATGRRHRVLFLHAALACMTLLVVDHVESHAQTAAGNLLNPVPGEFASPQDLPLRKISQADNPGQEGPAPSRIGRTPTYGLPAASGASDDGYDSLNRTRKKPKPYPGAPKLKGSIGPGNSASSSAPPPSRPLPPSSTANKTPLAPALAGTVPGQPTRRRLKPDDDPFGPVGDYAGSFLVKSAIELSGGYDTNPGRFTTPRGSAFYKVAPELVIASQWSRHSVVADLRGSFTGYGNTFPSLDGSVSPVPVNVDLPDFTGKIDGRLDVSRDTHVLSQLRLRVGTDNPGSPNIQAGLAQYPLYATTGGTLGVEQNFNRLQVTVSATADHTAYQDSKLTDGTSTTNDDRNFNQFGGIARVSYDLLPGVKPFGEIEGDTRVHETNVDRNGFQRDSNGGYAKAGTTFEFSRLLTGEISVGYALRNYQDPRLQQLTGLLTSASLVWSVSPLTTAKFISNTSVDETTLPGTAGVLTRTYTAEVDHDFRRWLTAIGRFTYGTMDYQGATRRDQTYSASADLIYKLNRSFWLKGQLRRDWLDSNIPGASTASTVVMLGVRLQN